MLKLIDWFLNSITMYRLVMYGLFVLSSVAILFGFTSLLPYSGFSFLLTLVILVMVCYFSNMLFAKMFRAVVNSESSVITAVILFFILAPVLNLTDLWITIAAGVIAMLSKYVLAVEKKHIFNPAAISVFLLGLFGFGNAIWWVGSGVLLPLVLILGLLVVRKIRRFSLFFAFLGMSLLTISFVNFGNNVAIDQSVSSAFFSWPLIFFGTIMLTEPLTTPSHRKLQVMYGAVVGVLFGLQFHIGPLFASPEFALVVGNVFSFIVSPKQKPFLLFKEKIQLSPTVFEFVFAKDKPLQYLPGQYMEWTIPMNKTDGRGNRRYFTIASSPTENEIQLGIKIAPDHPSTFKKALTEMKDGSLIVAFQISGSFVMPVDIKEKLVFIAGGIGVTPFRSMIKYLIDTKEKRDIVFFHVCSNEDEFVYKEIFGQAEKMFSLKIVHVLSSSEKASPKWNGEKGIIDEFLVKKYVPDYKERLFYLSGPNAMVDAYKKLILNLGVKRSEIKTDYFPGF